MSFHLRVASKQLDEVLRVLGSYAHSFTPSFYSEAIPKALIDLWKTDKAAVLDMVKDVLGEKTYNFYADKENIDDDLIYLLVDKIIETNVVGNLDSPVEVWVDPEGYHTLSVPDFSGPVTLA